MEDKVRHAKDQEQEKTKKLQETVYDAQEARHCQQDSRDNTQGDREKAKDQEQSQTGWTLRMNARYQEEVDTKQEFIQIENAVRGWELDKQESAMGDKKWHQSVDQDQNQDQDQDQDQDQEVGKGRNNLVEEEPVDGGQSKCMLKMVLASNVLILLMNLMSFFYNY